MLSPIARLKFGTSETTISGRLPRQKRSSRRTCLEWNRRISRCITFIICGDPSVQPFFSRRL